VERSRQTARAPRVAIIGGGYAGLGAAERLSSRGVVPVVFERSGHLGGLAMTLPVAGSEIEKYYHHWFTSDDDVLDLVEALGLGDKVRWISPIMGLFCRGRIYRFTSPADLLRFRPLSVVAKARFGLVTLFLQHYPKRELFEDVTAAAWLRRVAGREVFETIWGPLLRAKFGRHADEISMAWIWSQMRLRGRSRTRGGTKEALGYLDGGFGVLTERLAAEIVRRGGEIHRAERVVAVHPSAGGELEVVTPRRLERFDAVISTVAPSRYARLVTGLPADHRRACEEIEHAAILCTLLVLDRPISEIYWMNISDAAVPFGGLIEHTNFIPPDRYEGRHLAYLSHYVYPDEPIWGLDADALFRRYVPGLRRIRADFDESWVVRRLTFRDRFAQPIVTRDYQRRLLPIDTPLPGLFLATMAQVYPEDRGTNYAVRIGRAAAERAMRHLGSRLSTDDLPRTGDRETRVHSAASAALHR
jgi:protoporphyrinogen oxidase